MDMSFFDFEDLFVQPLEIDYWDRNRTYQQGKEEMINLCSQAVNGTETANVSDSVRITYPGRKYNGDYIADVYGHFLTHREMCLKIFIYITEKVISCEEMQHILEEMYENGYVRDTSDTDLIRELKKQIFWLTLQEDINYPIEKGNLGRKHPLFRYAEAFIAAQRGRTYGDLLVQVFANADNRLPKRIQLFDINGVIAPYYYNAEHYLN